MLIQLDRLIHAFLFVVMLRHLKIPTIPTVFVLVCLRGYKMAHLWRQLGGSSWNMIFSKRKLLQDIQALARLQYQVI